jgi:hypothetical protein
VTEWERRELCPDGACVGVIGQDGLCKVCGRAAQGSQGVYRESPNEPREEPEPREPEATAEATDTAHADDDGEAASAEWTRRALCSDGACVGVIGENGRCKVCGKEAAP